MTRRKAEPKKRGRPVVKDIKPGETTQQAARRRNRQKNIARNVPTDHDVARAVAGVVSGLYMAARQAKTPYSMMDETLKGILEATAKAIRKDFPDFVAEDAGEANARIGRYLRAIHRK